MMCHPEKRALALLALLMSLCGSVHAQPPSDFVAALLDALRADLLLRWKDTHLYTPAARRAALCAEFFGLWWNIERGRSLDSSAAAGLVRSWATCRGPGGNSAIAMSDRACWY